MQNKVSVKHEYEKKKGKEVSLDQFLFACYDTSRQLRAIDHRYQEKTFWPLLSGDDLEDKDLEEATTMMIKWYKSEFPVLSQRGAMDISRMGVVARNLAYFEKDFKALVKNKSGEYLEDHVLDQHDLTPPWTFLKRTLIAMFHGTGEKIWSYFTWAYGISPPEEVVNISQIPPVSRFQNQSSYAQNYQHNHNHREHHNNHQRRKNHHNGPHNHSALGMTWDDGGQQQYSLPQEKNRPRHKQGGNHKPVGGNHKQAGNYKQGGNPKKKQKSRSAADKLKEKQVKGLVDEAIRELESGNLTEVLLSPQNSFYRRVQHKYAVDRGFRSQSTGNEKRRAVKISKRQSS